MKNISLESWHCQLSKDIFFMKIETLLDELDAERCQFRKWDRVRLKKNLMNCRLNAGKDKEYIYLSSFLESW